MAADLADVACAPEKWRAVCLVAVDTKGGTMITRYKSEDGSGMELLGAMSTATKLLQRHEVGGSRNEPRRPLAQRHPEEQPRPL